MKSDIEQAIIAQNDHIKGDLRTTMVQGEVLSLPKVKLALYAIEVNLHFWGENDQGHTALNTVNYIHSHIKFTLQKRQSIHRKNGMRELDGICLKLKEQLKMYNP